jgi:replicative DNA helicase
MKLSAPIYLLKREARHLSRREKIPLHEALDRIAGREGFRSWSLLSAKAGTGKPSARIYGELDAGDLVLIGARPGQGKTLFSLELAAEAAKSGRQARVFSLDYSEKDVRDRLDTLDGNWKRYASMFEFDVSNDISAGHIIQKLDNIPTGTFVVVDYLQLLDQKRDNPDLMSQVKDLRSFARLRGAVIAFVSQIDRAYDPQKKRLPDLTDVRLPNPLDLKLFRKSCFLHAGEMRFAAIT